MLALKKPGFNMILTLMKRWPWWRMEHQYFQREETQGRESHPSGLAEPNLRVKAWPQLEQRALLRVSSNKLSEPS